MAVHAPVSTHSPSMTVCCSGVLLEEEPWGGRTSMVSSMGLLLSCGAIHASQCRFWRLRECTRCEGLRYNAQYTVCCGRANVLHRRRGSTPPVPVQTSSERGARARTSLTRHGTHKSSGHNPLDAPALVVAVREEQEGDDEAEREEDSKEHEGLRAS